MAGLGRDPTSAENAASSSAYHSQLQYIHQAASPDTHSRAVECWVLNLDALDGNLRFV